jgi:2-oxoacid:acceptor oxidoreductase delta subunit (pyruvate/2-ketoisovalerate family)
MRNGIAPIGKELYVIKTGDWRYQRPERDQQRCKKCGTCFIYCPTGSIYVEGGEYQTNYDYCKGCGICANECRADAISMVEETR